MRNRRTLAVMHLSISLVSLYGLPVLARSTIALGAAGLRPIAGTGDHQHLSFVAEAVEPGRGQQWVQEDI